MPPCGRYAVHPGLSTRPANGPGSGLFKSTDGGTTWQPLANGIPTEGLGRIGIAVAQANKNRIYAILDAKEGGLYSSSDAGATWTKISGDNRIWGRGWYFGKVTVDPRNADTVYVSNTSVYKSTNAGKSWTAIKARLVVTTITSSGLILTIRPG